MKVISTSLRKNLQMVVYHNTNAAGKKQSITRFLPLNDQKPCYKRQFGRPSFR